MPKKLSKSLRFVFEVYPANDGYDGWIAEVTNIPSALSYGATKESALYLAAATAAQIIREKINQ